MSYNETKSSNKTKTKQDFAREQTVILDREKKKFEISILTIKKKLQRKLHTKAQSNTFISQVFGKIGRNSLKRKTEKLFIDELY